MEQKTSKVSATTCDESTSKVEIKGKRFGRGAVESGLTHECGVFGVVATDTAAVSFNTFPRSFLILSNVLFRLQIDIAQTVCLGLVALQHRGQESAGIVTSEGKDSKNFNVRKGMGMINNIFTDENIKTLKGNLGIGHTRYSTSAASEEVNCQPFVVHTAHGPVALAHNGELVNCKGLRSVVLGRGVGLSTHSDSELITQSLCVNPPDEEVNSPDWPARIKHLMKLTKLSYSLVIMMKDKIYGVRDPFGNRPLCIGRIISLESRENGHINGKAHSSNGVDSPSDDFRPDDLKTDGSNTDGWVISSESCGFLSFGARYEREVLPGEIVEITKHGVRTIDVVERPRDSNNHILPQAFCIFEYVYFARSDSIFEGQMVYTVRMECGRQLALEAKVEADIVSSVPESGTAAAHGYSRESKIPFVEVLNKNRYVGRTFIQPSTRLRQLGVAKKFGALAANVAGKRLILIDDSIVRGNTIGPIIKLLRDAGAKEVHIRIASPPLLHPCYMGINIPTKTELIGNKMNPEELAKHVRADSLAYLSVDGLERAVKTNLKAKNKSQVGHCTACLTGKYPVELEF